LEPAYADAVLAMAARMIHLGEIAFVLCLLVVVLMKRSTFRKGSPASREEEEVCHDEVLNLSVTATMK